VTATVRTLATEEISKAYAGRRWCAASHGDCAGRSVGLAGTERRGQDDHLLHDCRPGAAEAGRILADGEDITRCPMYLARAAARHQLSAARAVDLPNCRVEENILAVLERSHWSWESRRTRRRN